MKQLDPRHVDFVRDVLVAELAFSFGRNPGMRHIELWRQGKQELAPGSVALALMMVAAHELVHDGASIHDAIAMLGAAWDKANTVHGQGAPHEEPAP